jgi:phosphatidate cytidylyltransferase
MTPSGSVPGNKRRELGLRIAAAVVLIPLVLALVWLGGWWFAGLLVLAGGLMAREWCAIVHDGAPVQFGLHLLGVLAATVIANLYGGAAALACIGVVWLAASVHTRLVRHRHDFWALAGVLYVALPLAALMGLRADPDYGLLAVVWLMVVVWSADTAAYAAGRGIGGPKLAPRISPGKTWAGLAGAAAGAALAGGLVGWLGGLAWLAPVALVAGAIGVVEQGGDLFESLLKRHHKRKDSGAVIPGHGGMLDRVDGLVAAALVAVIIGLVNGGPHHTGAGLLVW